MATFEDNFKAGQTVTVCPVCLKHVDSQEESFSCEKLRELLVIQGNYNDIFGSDYSPQLIKTLCNIQMFREEYRKINK